MASPAHRMRREARTALRAARGPLRPRPRGATIGRRVPLATTLALALLAGCFGPRADAAYRTERVVLVVIDGLRYSEGLGDPTHAQVPRMAALAQQGLLVEPFRNDGYTYTSRAIPAIWCGAWTELAEFSDPACGGAENSATELPTLFEYYRRDLARPAEDCVYVLKDLCSWKASFHSEYGPDYWPLYHAEGRTDLQVWAEAREILDDLAPRFLLLYLADVDHAGHSGVWDQYLTAIETADAIVGELWSYVQADPDYAGRTTLLVTNDHGRHTGDWTGHGCGCAGCRAIQLLAVGPDTPAGRVSTEPRTLRDITPTIGHLLGFATGHASGAAMREIFVPDSVSSEPAPPVLAPLLAVDRNPCRPGAHLSFRLPAPGVARLLVFDAAGALVARPYDGASPLDEFHFSWDARSSRGEPMPSGVYFLRLEASGGSDVLRLVLTR